MVLKQELDQYVEVAGLKININKMKILSKNSTQQLKEELSHISGIQITSRVKYLGVSLTNRLSSLYRDNYEKVLKETEKDLEKWEKSATIFFRTNRYYKNEYFTEDDVSLSSHPNTIE